MSLPLQEEEAQEDAREVQQGKPYHWKDWSIIRGRDCLYIWSDAAALELSNGSNGWFRFILDGKLATMYSSGSPEGGSDSSGRGAHNVTGLWGSLLLYLIYSPVLYSCLPSLLSSSVSSTVTSSCRLLLVPRPRVPQRVPGEAAAGEESGEAGDVQSAHPVQRGSQ